MRSIVLIAGISLVSAPVYWRLRRKDQLLFLVVVSGGVLFWLSPTSFACLCLTGLCSLLGAGAALAGSAGTLVALKVAGAAGFPLLPLGASYYLLRQIHLAAERLKQTLARPSALELFAYLFFFPILLVGPIMRISDFTRSWQRQRLDWGDLSWGLERMLVGLFRVVVVADFLLTYKLGNVLNYDGVRGTWGAWYLAAVIFPIQAYQQLAGYSDVAIGSGRLLGFEVPENFDHPFASRNYAQFWRRYHMSLSNWCRDYIFYPVAASTRLPMLATLAGMLVLAGWHEISAGFLAWGGLQAVGVLVAQRFPRPLPGWLARTVTFHYFALTCLLIKPA